MYPDFASERCGDVSNLQHILNGLQMKQETNQQASRPEHEPLVRERSNPIPKGELCRLVSDGDIEAIRALQKIATPTALKSELFSRDYHRTPLALALKHGDKQLISLLLSLGKESLIFKKYTVWIVKKSKSNLAGCLWSSASIHFFFYRCWRIYICTWIATGKYLMHTTIRPKDASFIAFFRCWRQIS